MPKKKKRTQARDKLGRFLPGSKPWNKGKKTGYSYWKGKKLPKETKLKISKSKKAFYRKHPEVAKLIAEKRSLFFKTHPEANELRKKRVSATLKKMYKENPKLAKLIDKAVTEWWRNHPNIRKERSIAMKQFFLAHPYDFRKKFMNGKRNPFKAKIKTKQGFKVRSKGEKKIADFLFKHKINCKYESEVLNLDGQICVPDFYLPSYKVFIEYYGGYPGSRTKKVWKNKLYKKYSVHCVFITPGELGDLRKYIFGDLKKWFGKVI